jgi:hypothetical protein
LLAPKLFFATAAAGAAIAFAAAPAAHATDVCNEAQSSWKGVYSVSGDPVDPNPPARHPNAAMKVGNGNGKGLVNAAFHSPALRTCGPDTPPSPGTTDPGTTDPGTTDPGTTDPGTTDPGDGGPILAG